MNHDEVLTKPGKIASPQIGVMFRREQHPATLPAYAQKAESMGFDQLWVVEDCFYHGGVAQAGIALASTARIKVGLGINPAVARNPVFLAMEYATLAVAFPGRFIGGIGHGVAGWMEQIGAKPASWLQSIEETAAAVRAILRGEEVSSAGRYVRLDRARLEYTPESVPPVLLGVQGEKSLRLAGRCADGVLLVEGSGPGYVRWARALMDDERARSGQVGRGDVFVYALSQVSDHDPASARRKARAGVATFVGDGNSPTVAPLDFAADLRALATAGGTVALREQMPDAWLDELAVTGTSGEARAAVSRLAEAGANAVILVAAEDDDWDAWLGDQAWAVSRS